MLVRDISFDTPEENILFDEVLFSLAEKTGRGETIRFWESTELFVVLGRIGKIETDLNIDAVRKNRLKVTRRASGGGTVLQGKGILNYTFVFSKDRKEIRELKQSYRYILGKCVDVLRVLGVKADFFPISDIALVDGQKKISGNAQKRGKHFIMHHGTLLIDFDLDLMEKYLTIPQDRPEYRKDRPHHDFLSNVHVSRREFKKVCKELFHSTGENDAMTEGEEILLREFQKTRDVLVEIR